jgi:hypothetical protein
MRDIKKNHVRAEKSTFKLLALAAAAALYCGSAHPGSLDLGNGLSGQYKLVTSYAAAVRTGKADDALINGPVDPFQTSAGPGCPAGQAVCFSHTGLPSTANFDDGDRNFKQWSLINNRISMFGQLEVSSEGFGIIASGNAFYDQAYRSNNDNDSPDTVNKTGPNQEFTGASRKYDGFRYRLLEAYAFGSWNISDESNLNLRFGKQVTAYGESLFLSGVSSAMGPFDATKAFVAGAEIKDIILPENRVSMQWSLNNKTTILADYQLDFSPTEIFSVGSYFSPADLVGPGATFGYGSQNPAFSPCPGLLPGGLTTLCDINTQYNILANAVDGPRTINVQREPDIMPSKYGHYSLGLKYQLTPTLNVGLFRLRYANHNPTVNLNTGFAYIGRDRVTGTPVTTGVINQYVPVSYNIKYFDGIDMTAISYTTALGSFNIAGEFSYREGTDVSIKTEISGVISPVSTRGNIAQALLSVLYVNNPRFIADELVFVGEAGVIHVTSVEPVPSSNGIRTYGNGDVLFYDKTSYGFQFLTFPTVRDMLPGWDLQLPVSFGMIIKGNPSMSGAFGPLYAEGDKRLSIGAKMQYLQNFEIGVTYNMFFGDVNKTIGDSPLKANPYADRDNASINFKYSI